MILNLSWQMLSEHFLMVKMQEPVLSGVKVLGKPGFLMYEVLVEMVDPQVVVEMTQQTPKPAAQEPEAVPPLLPHSEEV